MLNICGLCDRKFQSINSEDYCPVCRKVQMFRVWRCEQCEAYRGECIDDRCYSLIGLFGQRPDKDHWYKPHKWIKIDPEIPWKSKHSRRDINEQDELIELAQHLKKLAQENNLQFGY